MTMLLPDEVLKSARVAPVKISKLPSKPTLRVLALPDLHLPLGPSQKRLLLNNRRFLEEHDWVVLLGDMTAFYGTHGEYREVNRFIDELDRPYSVVNGNHEFHFLPAPDGSVEYGRRFEAGPLSEQRRLFHRFERFYNIESRYDAGSFNDVGICLLSLDRIGPRDEALLSSENEAWFSGVLERFENRPLIVFSHFPLCDARLESVRYYQEGRRPYLLPTEPVRQQLRDRACPTFWFSGHVHFRPMHPLATPYQTEDGVWQIHCPDGRGYGRADTDHWEPKPYEGLWVCSLELQCDRLVVTTTDLQHKQVVRTTQFSLTAR